MIRMFSQQHRACNQRREPKVISGGRELMGGSG